MARTGTTRDGEGAARPTVDGDAAIAPQTELRAAGRVLARATTQLLPSSAGTTLNIHLKFAPGTQPSWAHKMLVHDLVRRAERLRIDGVLMVIPLGDSEILDTLRESCHSVTTRPAGSTCIVEGRLKPAEPPASATAC